MKLEFYKQAGGILHPASDAIAERLTKFKTGEMYMVEIKRSRNPVFHRKVFAFFNFCFEYWRCDREFLDELKQFEVFRSHLTVVAGYFDELYNLKGEVRIEAKSLAYDSMDDDEFQAFYSALINAAMRTIFQGAGEDIETQLYSFF